MTSFGRSVCARACLPACGHGRGNRAPCAGRAICASFAPLGVYIYAVGGESCTTRLPLLRSARLRLGTRASPSAIPSLRSALTSFGGYPTVTAHGTSGRVRRGASHLGLAPAPRAVSPGVFTALRAAMLRRRNTAFSPCDVYHRASAEPSRRVSLSSPLGTPLRFLTTC